MSTKGIAAIRAARTRQAPAADPDALLLAVRDAMRDIGVGTPGLWGDQAGDHYYVRFSSAESLELRVASGRWALWFAGTHCGEFSGPGPALAEARSRGWLR